MWQVVRDTQDGLMEANLYTDEWPDFTTVISQEFSPRLSEVADLRIHTRDKERVMQVINGAKLLEKTGKWQGIFWFEDKEERLSTYLSDAISKHRALSDKVITGYKLPLYHMPKKIIMVKKYAPHALPPGYVLKDLVPEHAEIVAKHWFVKDWMVETVQFEQKLQYVKEVIDRFDTVGIFTTDNPSQPVAWSSIKPGGMLGILHTIKEHRKKKFIFSLCEELIARAASKDKVLTAATKLNLVAGTDEVLMGTAKLGNMYDLRQIGHCHSIVLCDRN